MRRTPAWLRPVGLFIGMLWASPYSLLGLLLAVPACVLGARVQRCDHTLECTGGQLGLWAQRLPNRHRIAAITLGHVILAVDATAMNHLRAHEREHVRQYAHWGPLFGPAYLGESLWQILHGHDAYRANRFERVAYARGGPFADRQSKELDGR